MRPAADPILPQMTVTPAVDSVLATIGRIHRRQHGLVAGYGMRQTYGKPLGSPNDFRMNTHAMGRPDISRVSPRPTSTNPLAL